MEMLKELFTTDVGLLSLACIVFMIVMAIWLYFWMEKRVEKDTAAKRERDKMRAAAARKT